MARITNEVLAERIKNYSKNTDSRIESVLTEMRAQRELFKDYSTTKEIDLMLDPIRDDLLDAKEILKNSGHVVIDNTSKTDWKAIGALIVAVIGALGTLYLTIKGA